jgi:hypothetical protein
LIAVRDRSITACDESIAARDRSITACDESIAARDRFFADDCQSIAGGDRSKKCGDRSITVGARFITVGVRVTAVIYRFDGSSDASLTAESLSFSKRDPFTERDEETPASTADGSVHRATISVDAAAAA